MTARHLTRPVAVAGLATALGALTGCGASSHVAARSTPATVPTTLAVTASAPPPAAASAALAAYNGMWQSEQTAALTADYNSPLLSEHAAGAALSILVRGLYSAHLQNLVVKGALVTHPRVTMLTPAQGPTQATIVDCFDDTHWLNYKASGGLQNGVPGGHRRVTATVTDSTAGWKVTLLNVGAEGTC
jgi:hypothetical protein